MSENRDTTHAWLMERRYFSLIIASVFIILSAITFFLCYQHYTISSERVLKDDVSATNLLSLLLDERLNKIVSVMVAYSNRPLLLQAVRNQNAKEALVHLISLTKSNRDIDSVIITDRQGTLWATYPERPEVLGKNLAYRDWYKDISKEWKTGISDVMLRIVEEKDLAVQISVPCVNEKGEVIGILVNTQRTATLSNLIKQVPLDPGQAITVTDRKGQIIYSSEHDIKTEIRPYPFYPGIKKAMAAKNKTFAVDDPDLGGRTRYISFAPVTNIGWTVSVERDKRSILLSGSAYYVQVTAITFLLFLTIILFLFYSRKQVATQQILEELQTEKIIRAGDAKFRALIENIQVGILAHAPDTSILLSNPMASEILGLTPDQMRGKKAIDPVWCFIREDGTKVPPAEYPVNRALAEEMPITGLVLGVIRPDRQSPTWVECNARKILGPAGELEQAIVVFSDITQRKRAEAAVQQKADELRASNDELALFNLAATGRELRMIELKQEINELCHRLGEPPRHEMDQLETDNIPGAGL